MVIGHQLWNALHNSRDKDEPDDEPIPCVQCGASRSGENNAWYMQVYNGLDWPDAKMAGAALCRECAVNHIEQAIKRCDSASQFTMQTPEGGEVGG